MGIIAQYLRVSEDELTLYQAKSVFLEKRMESRRDDTEHWLDIDKVWDGIIYLLTGDGLEKASGQLLQVIVGTRYIDERLDFGCGPAHYLDADEVQDLYEELSTWDEAKLYKRFDAHQMRILGILPDAWGDDEAFNYLLEYFKQIQAFYHKAAINHEAIVGVMSSEQENLVPDEQESTPFFQQIMKHVSSSLVVEKVVLSITVVATFAMSWQVGTLFGIG